MLMKTTRSLSSLLVLMAISLIFCSALQAKGPRRVLVFSKTAAFRHHDGIAAGKLAILKMGAENKFQVDTTEDASVFNVSNLKKYAAVVFLSTTGDVLNSEQQSAFEQYIRAGGGFMGIHAATDTEYDWPWYGELVGAYFGSHPAQQEAIFNIVDANNIATRHLPKPWKKKDELYNFKWIAEGINVLIKIDENSYNGGKNGAYHPMSWYRSYDGGRSFYTAMGHEKSSFADPLYLRHVLGGIEYAMGAKPDATLTSK